MYAAHTARRRRSRLSHGGCGSGGFFGLQADDALADDGAELQPTPAGEI
jgi:hypothetical protein